MPEGQELWKHFLLLYFRYWFHESILSVYLNINK